MIKIKKTTLVILVILGVLCGAAGLFTLQTSGLLGRLGIASAHTLNEAQYQEYRHLSSTYGKLDELRDYLFGLSKRRN